MVEKRAKVPGRQGTGNRDRVTDSKICLSLTFLLSWWPPRSNHSERCIAQAQSIFHSWVVVCSSRKHACGEPRTELIAQLGGAVFEHFFVIDLVWQILFIPGIRFQEFTFQTEARYLKVMVGGSGTASGLQINLELQKLLWTIPSGIVKSFNWFNPSNLKISNSQLGTSLNPIGKQEPALALI